MEKERDYINKRWKGEWIWKWERKGKKWIKGGKDDKYESRKEKERVNGRKENKYESGKGKGKKE